VPTFVILRQNIFFRGKLTHFQACLAGAVGSVTVRAAWLWW